MLDLTEDSTAPSRLTITSASTYGAMPMYARLYALIGMLWDPMAGKKPGPAPTPRRAVRKSPVTSPTGI